MSIIRCYITTKDYINQTIEDAAEQGGYYTIIAKDAKKMKSIMQEQEKNVIQEYAYPAKEKGQISCYCVCDTNDYASHWQSYQRLNNAEMIPYLAGSDSNVDTGSDSIQDTTDGAGSGSNVAKDPGPIIEQSSVDNVVAKNSSKPPASSNDAIGMVVGIIVLIFAGLALGGYFFVKKRKELA